MAEKKIDLYLKIKQESGMKFMPVDPLTLRVDPKQKVMLFYNKPTSVPEKVANRLLEQDPHLVSKSEYAEAEDIQIKTAEVAKKKREEFESERTMETTLERAKANQRFVRAAKAGAAARAQKVSPSVDPGLMKEETVDKDVLKYVPILSEFSELNQETVKRSELFMIAKQLDMKPGGMGIKREKLLAMVNEEAEKLTKKIKAAMDKSDRQYEKDAIAVAKAEAETPKPGKTSGLLPEIGPDTEIMEKQEEASTVEALEESPGK